MSEVKQQPRWWQIGSPLACVLWAANIAIEMAHNNTSWWTVVASVMLGVNLTVAARNGGSDG